MRKFSRILATVLVVLTLSVVIAPAVVRAESVSDDVYTVPGDVYGVPGSKTMVIVMYIGSEITTIDGVEGQIDAGPQIKWGRTFTPIAPIIKALGGTIEWNASTHTVTIVLGTKTLVLTMGNAYAVGNGKRIPIDTDPDVAPYIQAPGHTMLPVRFIAEKLGASVMWNSALHSVTLVFVKQP